MDSRLKLHYLGYTDFEQKCSLAVAIAKKVAEKDKFPAPRVIVLRRKKLALTQKEENAALDSVVQI